MPLLRSIIADEIRLLTFQPPSPAVEENWRPYLVFGLVFTWLAGLGRYWDHPDALLYQYLGLGSLAYVVCLALVLWLMVLPLRPGNRWSFRNVLVFLTMTSPPAVLYAIPVERFMPLSSAQLANGWFLAIVALWRVALLIIFVGRVTRLSGVAVGVATFLPISLIVVALASLNLEKAIFEIMGGIQPGTGNDSAYKVVLLLAWLSCFVAPVLFLVYLGLILVAFRDKKRQADSAGQP